MQGGLQLDNTGPKFVVQWYKISFKRHLLASSRFVVSTYVPKRVIRVTDTLVHVMRKYGILDLAHYFRYGLGR